ncbi:hypothetical protein HW555_008205 [Spodoptera exigua]|uniref:Uncharacterized protein n=1 Tax=Spodoptera exigua TaxID=7107 RepID=A0A835L3N3_SPOEX|nr:hypothetical protein HW555_008205 [Spodoptera exigua]
MDYKLVEPADLSKLEEGANYVIGNFTHTAINKSRTLDSPNGSPTIDFISLVSVMGVHGGGRRKPTAVCHSNSSPHTSVKTINIYLLLLNFNFVEQTKFTLRFIEDYEEAGPSCILFCHIASTHQLAIIDVVFAPGGGHVEPVAGGEPLVAGVPERVDGPHLELCHQALWRW